MPQIKLYVVFRVVPNPDDPYLDEKKLDVIFTDYDKALDYVSKNQDCFIEEIETQ